VMSAEDDCRDDVDELALGRSLLRRRSLRQSTHNTVQNSTSAATSFGGRDTVATSCYVERATVGCRL